ncbi:membrane protein [soil metagenome]
MADELGSQRRASLGAVEPEAPRRFPKMHRAPWWAKVVVVFLLSRVVTTALMLFFAARQQPNAWTGANPGYADFASIWDGHWYYIISVAGYPSELPITADGHVGESAWAFMPAYPAVVRLLMLVTGLGFPELAVFVSVACALGAALVFYRLLALVLPAETALFSVVLFCVAPLSPILQVSYAESMHLLLLVTALYLLVQRRYWMLLPVVAVMSLTRPSGLAFALTLALHVGYRFWRRRAEEFPVRERVASVTAALFSAASGFAWPAVAWAITGSPTAYTDTELAWRAPYIGYQELVPLTPWFKAAGFWAGQWGIPVALLVVILLLAVVGFFASLFTPWAKRLGVDLRFWLASYALYLLAVFFPQSSTFRLLVPLFPALGALAQPRSAWYRASLVVVLVAGQAAWVNLGWWVDGYDWTPP